VAASAGSDLSFASDAYRYGLTIPGDLVGGEWVRATEPWDGQARIDSVGPRTDHAYLADGRLLFAYGAPTDLGLDAYATASQAQKTAWHGCPSIPDTSTPVTVGGTRGTLVSFTCGGLHILSFYAVRDGFGVVLNLMNPPGAPEADAAIFERLLPGWSWAG
jgi:hypothetical protein